MYVFPSCLVWWLSSHGRQRALGRRYEGEKSPASRWLMSGSYGWRWTLAVRRGTFAFWSSPMPVPSSHSLRRRCRRACHAWSPSDRHLRPPSAGRHCGLCPCPSRSHALWWQSRRAATLFGGQSFLQAMLVHVGPVVFALLLRAPDVSASLVPFRIRHRNFVRVPSTTPHPHWSP